MDVNMKNIFSNIDSIEQFLHKNIKKKKVGDHSFIISSANKMAERSRQACLFCFQCNDEYWSMNTGVCVLIVR